MAHTHKSRHIKHPRTILKNSRCHAIAFALIDPPFCGACCYAAGVLWVRVSLSSLCNIFGIDAYGDIPDRGAVKDTEPREGPQRQAGYDLPVKLLARRT